MHPTYIALGIFTDARGMERMADFLGLTKCGKYFANGTKMMSLDSKNHLLQLTATKDDALRLSYQFGFEFE